MSTTDAKALLFLGASMIIVVVLVIGAIKYMKYILNKRE
ncbi:hypothetical protein DDD_0575 [Nonlabens dokdonensis DSW-6]|uniref:Uncharacterized protein n=1 Tax=Nonlabens dokdonensis (strain DSM 17205 / KCTC 12402 / DSW-6) TaxID=592029 RepID=L7W695_NONDD|nr:hypothetical protein DDD_0575 [Nonlabens dokdonensis DSW-6]